MSSMTTLAKVHAMLPGSLLLNISAQDAERLMLSRVGTDSRQIDAGELFIALAGERFDAHDFLVDVANSGAGAALVSDAKNVQKTYQLYAYPILALVLVNSQRRGAQAMRFL